MLEIIENDGGKMKDYTFLTEAAEKVIDYYQIPGCAMAVAEGGEISFFHFGWADKKTRKNYGTYGERYRILHKINDSHGSALSGRSWSPFLRQAGS